MRIWKLSHGKDISDDLYRDALSQKKVWVHKDTLAKAQSSITQGDNFTKIAKEGDIFYLCRGNSHIVLVGCFKTKCHIQNDGWAYRNYDILFEAKVNQGYNNDKHWWTPNDNSTFIEINSKDQQSFEQLILKPFFNVTLLDVEKKLSLVLNTKKMEQYKKLLETNHNLILTGAPGTGKTYLAKEIAKEMGCNDDEIGFVQFHPSYDYTDFVEGLRPIQDDNGTVGFERKDGVFKEFCKKAMSITKSNFDEVYSKFIKDITENGLTLNTLIYKKDFKVKIIDDNLFAVPNTELGTLQFIEKEKILNHLKNNEDTSSYIPAIAEYIKTNYDIKIEDQQNINKNYVFIIDEINRGEISKIFGELFFSIDPGYRGIDENGKPKGLVKTQYQNLIDEDDEFYGGFFIPENVYIIGTMNDIDRSVESMDFAFRRRFAFKEIKADENVGMLDNLEASVKDKAINRMKNLNNAISQIDGLSSAYHIGGSYFLKLKNYDNDFEQLWDYHIEGLLREYLRGNPEIEKHISDLKAAYNNEN